MGRPALAGGCSPLRLLALAGAWRGTRAWVAEGHQRIAEVAEHLLDGSHAERIHAMLEGRLEEFADWEQKMTAAHPGTAALQWHVQEPEWSCSGMIGEHGHINCNNHGAANSSVYCAVLYFFEHLSDNALMKHDPRPRYIVRAPSQLEPLADLSESELGRPQLIRWLVALVGDMHQPLHWLKERGFGKDVQLTYKGETYSLLDFWEDYIPKHLESHKDFRKIRHVFHKNQEHYLQRSPAVHLQNWARDMATAVCSRVYAPLLEGGNASRGEAPFQLEEKLYQEWMRLATELTVTAGQRVAALLLDLLRHKRHGTANQDGRALWHPWLLRDPSGFIYNALIALPVVPGVLGLLVLHERLVGGKGRPSCLPSSHVKD